MIHQDNQIVATITITYMGQYQITTPNNADHCSEQNQQKDNIIQWWLTWRFPGPLRLRTLRFSWPRVRNPHAKTIKLTLFHRNIHHIWIAGDTHVNDLTLNLSNSVYQQWSYHSLTLCHQYFLVSTVPVDVPAPCLDISRHPDLTRKLHMIFFWNF